MLTEATTTKFDYKYKSRLQDLELAVDFYIFNLNSRDKLRTAIFGLAENINQIPKTKIDQETLLYIQELSRRIWSSGYHGYPVLDKEIKWAYRASNSGWRGLIGAMLVSPAWQWTESLPNLSTVPDWLLNSYIDWIFVAPCITNATGANDLHLAKLETVAEQLNLLSNRKKISSSTKAAMALFLRNAEKATPLHSSLPIRRWSESRSSIFARFYLNPEDSKPPPIALPIKGRTLKIGVILPNWGDTLAARAIWPRLSSLDPGSFDVQLFAERALGDKFEKHCRNSVSKFQILPHSSNARADMLYGAKLDVLIFGGTLNSESDMQLALHRFAALQIATDTCIGLTGLSGIDLHLSALPEATAEFAEPIAQVQGPSFVWESEIEAEAFETPSRDQLGLPNIGPVFVSFLQLDKLSPEVLNAWYQLLAADTTSSLLLLLPTESDSFALEQILDQIHTAADLSPNRIVVSLGDPRTAFSLGDIYLDTYPCSTPTSLLAAIAAGLPAVTWEGTTYRSRTGSQVLRELGQQEWIATDCSGYVSRALRLLNDENVRSAARKNLAAKIEFNRGLGDSILASLQFGAIIKHVYDLHSEGGSLNSTIVTPKPKKTFKTLEEEAHQALNRRDFSAAIEAAADCLRVETGSTAARSLLGRAYLKANQTEVAMACFFSALRGREQEANLWLDIGAALQARNEIEAAINAYNTALHMDASLIDGWIAIADLTRAKGEHHLANDALDVARRINANDPRLQPTENNGQTRPLLL